MEPRDVRGPPPEEGIKAAIKKLMESRGWLVVVTHGNKFQKGLPDLYCAHRNHGTRWIEVKYAWKYSFTDNQKRLFPLLAAEGVNIYVLMMEDHRDEAVLESEYLKLWKPPNWADCLGHSQRHI